MRLSIIVPIYNVEAYLRRCVDSILSQTFTDFELILVDDGSPDACGKICDEYALQDKRIRVIHKKNGGLSDARNAGLDVAMGEFVGFIDSDDTVAPEMYERMFVLQARTNADVVSCGILNFDQNGNEIGRWPHLNEAQIYSRADFINNFYSDVRRNIMPSVANKIFRHDIFRTVRFPVGKIYEDAQIRLKIYDKCQIIAVSPDHMYHYYCARPGSINNVEYSEKQFDMIDFSLSYYQFYLERKDHRQSEYAMAEYVNNYMKNFFQVVLFHKELLPKFDSYRKKFSGYFLDLLKNGQICKMKKIAIMLLYVHKKTSYKLCLRLFPECVNI